MKVAPLKVLVAFAFWPSLSLAQACNSVDSVDWLLGYWVAEQGQNITTETWKRMGARAYEGWGETRVKTSGDLKGSELLRLVEMGGEVFYLAKPKQNEYPVAFKLNHCSSGHAIFENTAHDFPQKLDYKKSTPNTLNVTVSGAEGKSFSISFTQREGS